MKTFPIERSARRMAKRVVTAIVAPALVVAAVSLAALPLFAHEKGVLTIGTKQASAGDTLRARGSKLAKDAGFRIELRGALKTYSFGRIRTDTAGVFTMSIPLPADASPGSYRIVAIASDGDVSAQAEFLMNARHAGGGQSMAGMPGMANMPGMGNMPGMDMRATAAKMEVPTYISRSEGAAIALILILSVSGGVLLIRPRRAREAA